MCKSKFTDKMLISLKCTLIQECMNSDYVYFDFFGENRPDDDQEDLYAKVYASWTLTRKGWVYDHFFGEAEDPEDCIVVGNIFDNPQLKKKYGKDWEEEHK